MKKILVSMIAIVLSMTLGACGSNRTATNQSGSSETEHTHSNEYKQPEQGAGTPHSKNQKKLVDVTLDRTVDGDTIKVIYNGKKTQFATCSLIHLRRRNRILVFSHTVRMRQNEIKNWSTAVSCSWNLIKAIAEISMEDC